MNCNVKLKNCPVSDGLVNDDFFSIVNFHPPSELTGYKTAFNYTNEYISVYCSFIYSVYIPNIEENTKSISFLFLFLAFDLEINKS